MSKDNRYLSYDFTASELNFLELREAIFNYWLNIGINLVDYKGIEDVCHGLTSEILEEQLFKNGVSVFFKDKERGFFALKPVANGNLNVYGRNLTYTPYGFGESFSPVTIGEDAVLIKNNALMKPTEPLLNYYASQIADLELTKQCNRDAIKTPFFFYGDDKSLLSAKNIFKQIHCNMPAIFKNKLKGGDNELGVEVLNTGAEFYGAELDDQINNYEAKILTLLGLDNFVEDKKERVQAAEVESQEEYILASFAASVEARKKAVKEINEMFDLSIEVVPFKSIEPKQEEPKEPEDNGGNEDDQE